MMINTFSIKASLAGLAFMLTQQFSFAQSSSLGGWQLANLSYRMTDRFSFMVEMQARSQELTKDFFYHEIKGGLMYSVIPKKLTVLLAIGDYRTYDFKGNFNNLKTKEFRLWQQVSFSSNIDPVKIDHRFRAEQRWQNGNFRNRFRYRLNPVVPINRKTIVPKTLYASVFNELFFTNTAPYFERNRFFVGLGYQFNKLFAFQSGYLRQYDYRKVDDGSGKNYLQNSLLFFIDGRHKQDVRHPNTLD